MSSSCPHFNVTYATWRLQTLRQLYAGPGSGIIVGLPFLSPTGARGHNNFRGVKHTLHNTASRARNNLKDIKRSAKYKVARLQLPQNVQHPRDDTEQSSISALTSLSHDEISKHRAPDWNPYDDSSIEEMYTLVGDLKAMAKEAARRESEGEGVPFEGSISLKRKKFGTPESPLERRLPWDREKKLQAQEVKTDKRLANNVWAQMLSSPLRMDRSTKARLPRDLMVDWSVVRNPSDKEDYLLPLELSDLEALEKELKSPGGVNHAQSHGQPEKEDRGLSSRGRNLERAHRIPIAPNRFALKAMTDEFIITPPVHRGEVPRHATRSPSISGTLIPFHWRVRQTEMQMFQKTRQRFYDVLERKPDADEPDMDSMAKLQHLQWQPGVAARVEKILRDRVLIVLEALSRDNQSVRAVHHRRVMALPIPDSGQLYLDARGRISETEPVKHSREVNEEVVPERDDVPDWIHGAILLHVGDLESLQTTMRSWSKNDGVSRDRAVTASDMIPPMIGINDRFRLPIFDLDTLLGRGNNHRVRQWINENNLLQLDFWNQYNNKQTRSEGNNSTDENCRPSTMRSEHPSSTADTPTDTSRPVSSSNSSSSDETMKFRPVAMPLDQPETTTKMPIDAGEQVLSSILSPGAAAAPPMTNSNREAPGTPTSSRSQKILISGSDPEGDNRESTPYLILVKATAKHAGALAREMWQLWRYNGGTTPPQ